MSAAVSSDWPDCALATADVTLAPALALRVRDAIGRLWTTRPAISLRQVCDAGSFRVVRTSKLGLRDAYLLPRSTSGFDVVVRESLHQSGSLVRRRLRFALAHEIGHSFFFNRRAVPHQRCCDWTDGEERFCNLFASNLLVPGSELAGRPWTPATLKDIRERYDVSLQVAALSAVEHHPGSVAVSLLQTDHPTKGMALRIAWVAGTPFVPLKAQLRSKVAEAAWKLGAAQGWEVFRLGQLKGSFHVTAERESDSSQVMVLIRPRTEAERYQLKLFHDAS